MGRESEGWKAVKSGVKHGTLSQVAWAEAAVRCAPMPESLACYSAARLRQNLCEEAAPRAERTHVLLPGKSVVQSVDWENHPGGPSGGRTPRTRFFDGENETTRKPKP